MLLKESPKIVKANARELSYSGRIDFTDPLAPIFIFPASSVTMIFKGSKLKALVKNRQSNYSTYIGYVLDGVEEKVILPSNKEVQKITLAENLNSDKQHEIVFFKRQDTRCEFTFYGFIVDTESKISMPRKKYRKCMEFYGESAACGKSLEDIHCTNAIDLSNSYKYSNAWNSYAMMTARNLKAEVNIIAQEGIALLDNTGYFNAPQSIGMESIYDKLHFNFNTGEIVNWDFNRYIPQVVVIDIGQNDSIPKNYMKEDLDSYKSINWRNHYKEFVLNIRRRYKNAFIVLTTTIIKHDSSWDRAIGLVCEEINDKKIVHFLYSCNGFGGDFHNSKWCAEEMSLELSLFLKGLGAEIWEK